jgi:hypothetical protein
MPVWLTGLLGAIGPLITWISGRSAAANTPAMVANKEKQNETQEIDKIRDTLKTGTLDDIRRANS